MNIARSPKTWITRIVAAGAAVAASVVLATSTAHAYIPPSPSWYAGTPSVVQPSMYCGGGRIALSVVASVQPGYTGGQYASYRFVAYSGGRLITASGWSGSQYLPYATTSMGATTTYGRSPVGSTTLVVTPGYYFEVAVQVAWYTSAGWSYSQWTVPAGYRSGFAGLQIPNTGIYDCRS
jgi:hypothetical protein